MTLVLKRNVFLILEIIDICNGSLSTSKSHQNDSISAQSDLNQYLSVVPDRNFERMHKRKHLMELKKSK
jgi:hypothetical protein